MTTATCKRSRTARMGGRDVFRCENFLCIGLLLSSIYVLSVEAQSIPGFISIDCGSAPYSDKVTTLSWEDDNKYTFTGVSGEVPFTVNSSWENADALQTFRYFPDRRSKHCYDLPTTSNISFLIRAMFLHGSASELTLPIEFDVAVNGTNWATLSYGTDTSYDVLKTPLVYEGIFHSPGALTHFCLVPRTGVPFISSLELRQFDPDGTMYSFPGSTKRFLSGLWRYNCGAAVGSTTVRYPDDQFDRLWFAPGEWAASLNALSGSGTVKTTTAAAANNVPPKVMQDAWVNNTAGSQFGITFSNFGTSVTELYAAIYFEEIVANATDGERLFNIYVNGYEYNDITKSYATLRWFADWQVPNGTANFTFAAANGSSLGPVVNAMEVYAQFTFNDSATAQQDVDALAVLQTSFNLSSWQGDPCFPVAWDWVGCTTYTPARVNSLLLSSMGIDASIPPNISNLDALTKIRLDNNSLYGTIPDSLTSLPDLTYLDLSDNGLSGDVPQDLVTKLGSNFFYSGNTLLGTSSPGDSSPSPSSPKKKSSSIGIAIAGIAGGIVGLAVVLGILLWYFCSRKKKLQQNPPVKEESAIPVKQSTAGTPSQIKPQPPVAKNSKEVGRVSYETVQLATNNFSVKIGQGSYGSVFHGWLNEREVAVKLNNIQSDQGHNEFITEVDILTRVHHRNLVSLMGFCDEGNELTLIYEFERNGTLQEWIHDDKKTRGTLDWKRRLQIAADGARGLEYLHKGCDPTIIHRDVKSSNILLDESMTAKVADFGLSKSAPSENTLGYSTGVKGTPGYLDPEYHHLGRLTHKSDVYSYGVVLAELITGRPPFRIQSGSSAIILVDYLQKMVQRNDIDSLADPDLKGLFETESMWRMADIALLCVDPVGVNRPDFTQVLSAVTEAMELEKSFTVHSPLPLSRSFMSRTGSNHRYQNLP